MKRIYLQPAIKVIVLAINAHLCQPSITTGREGPWGNVTNPDDDDAPSREFRWDYGDE